MLPICHLYKIHSCLKIKITFILGHVLSTNNISYKAIVRHLIPDGNHRHEGTIEREEKPVPSIFNAERPARKVLVPFL